MKKPSKLEQLSGSVPAKLTAAGIAAFDGGILSAFLPVLFDSIPARRNEKRIQESFSEVHRILEKHSDEISDLSDAQYKLINNAAVTMLSTVEAEKLGYLKSVIENSFGEPEIRFLESEIISRWLRDISVEEVMFILQNYANERIAVSSQGGYENCLFVEPGSRESSIVAGLVSLGVLVSGGPNIDTLGTYTFSDITGKFIALVGMKHNQAPQSTR